MSAPVHFAVVRLELHVPGAGSLKAKRALLNKVRAALRNDLDVSVAEVDHQDSWQRAVLGLATVASDATGVDRVVDRVRAVAERDPRVVVTGMGVEVDAVVFDPGDTTAGLLAHGHVPSPFDAPDEGPGTDGQGQPPVGPDRP